MSLFDNETIAEMRGWLADLTFRDYDAADFLDPDMVSDDEIVDGIRSHYPGGVAGFLAVLEAAA